MQEQIIDEEMGKNIKTVDSAGARREARRKRILENSNNRLTKITGREHSDDFTSEFTAKLKHPI